MRFGNKLGTNAMHFLNLIFNISESHFEGYPACRHDTVLRERPLDSQGGGGPGFFWKKYSGSGFGQKKYSGLDHVWTKYLGSIHWQKNVCSLSMKRKCLPSIHEKKMSALYIHANKMLALYKWYYHGSRTNLIFVSLSWSWWRNVGS